MTEIKMSICLISIFVVGNKKDIIYYDSQNSFNLSVDKQNLKHNLTCTAFNSCWPKSYIRNKNDYWYIHVTLVIS